MKTKVIIIFLTTIFIECLLAATPDDLALIDEITSKSNENFSYAFIFWGAKDINDHDITIIIGYDSSQSGENVIRKEIIQENGKSQNDTIFKYVDTLNGKSIVRKLKAVFENLPICEVDTSDSADEIQDTCFGKGFLFSMNSKMGGIE
jgi:hypothetical protein